MNWKDELQSWGVALLLAGGFYVVAGYLFRSLHPTGMLNWQGRRWRKGGALLILLCLGVADVRFNFQAKHISIDVAVVLWLAVGLLTLLLVCWWWGDARKEKAAEKALIEKLHSEGRSLAAPPMSMSKKAWRWTVNAYALFLVAAGLYALIRYLVRH
jgi:multidrug transporter EmrE-like cation transporter